MASALGDIPETLPALLRATRMSERAAEVGFDWTCIADIHAKVAEELNELHAALAASNGTTSAAVIEEYGDLLIALVNLSRHLQFDAESALRAASAKFERRFKHMEARAREQGRVLEDLSPAQWDELWCDAKRALAPAT